MQIRHYQDASQFYDDVLPFLVRREAEHCMMIGVLSTIADRARFQDWKPKSAFYFAAVFDENTVIAVAMLVAPRELILSYSENLAALNLLAQDLEKHLSQHQYDDFKFLPGIIATRTIGHAFAQIWSALTHQAHKIRMSQRIYQLERVIPVQRGSGHAERATEAHVDLLVEWLTAFNIEALNVRDHSTIRRLVQNRLHSITEALYLWFDPHPVAMLGTSGPTPNGIRINAVYTPPEYRRKGYASALTATISQKMLDEGRRYCFLYTDIENPTSNHIYQAIGYEPVCDADVIEFAPPDEAGLDAERSHD